MYNVWVEPIERRDERKKGEGVMPRAGTLTFLNKVERKGEGKKERKQK